MIPADEHHVMVTNEGPRGPRHAVLICDTCRKGFPGYTQALAAKAHRQHVAATDLAQNGRSTC